MKKHMKPSMKEKLDRSILHVGTNDLNSDRPSHLIAKSIVDLVITLKNNSHNVRDSNIIVSERYLKQLCTEKKFFFDRPYQSNPFKKHQQK